MSLVLRRVLYPLFQKAGTVSLVPKGGCYSSRYKMRVLF